MILPVILDGTLDDKLIQEAKRYELSSDQNEELTSSVKSLMGSFNAPKNFDYKKILRNEKQRKYE